MNAKIDAKPCLHCQEFLAYKPRGLCWRCFYNPVIRQSYGLVRNCGTRGVGAKGSNPPMADEATQAMPGSEEKICVFERRAGLGQQLFHEHDLYCFTPRPDSMVFQPYRVRIR